MTTAITLPLWAWLIICAIIGFVNFVIVTRAQNKREAALTDKFAEAFEHGARMQIISDMALLPKVLKNINLPEETKKLIIDEFIKNIRK